MRPVAPGIATQSPPAVLQRTQAYEKPIGCRPTQLPGCTVIVASTNGCPVAIGMDVFTGGSDHERRGVRRARARALAVRRRDANTQPEPDVGAGQDVARAVRPGDRRAVAAVGQAAGRVAANPAVGERQPSAGPRATGRAQLSPLLRTSADRRLGGRAGRCLRCARADPGRAENGDGERSCQRCEDSRSGRTAFGPGRSGHVLLLRSFHWALGSYDASGGMRARTLANF